MKSLSHAIDILDNIGAGWQSVSCPSSTSLPIDLDDERDDERENFFWENHASDHNADEYNFEDVSEYWLDEDE